MAESTLSVSKSDIDAAMAVELGYDPSLPLTGTRGQQLDRMRKAGLRGVYYALAGDQQGTVEWSFTNPPATLAFVAGTGDYDLPDDFAWVGAIGNRLVYSIGSNFVSAEKVDPHTLLMARARESGSTLSASIVAGDLSLTVDSIQNFPVNIVPFATFTIKIDSEMLRVTATSGTTFTVTRAFGGTSAASHSAAARVEYLGNPKRFAVRPKSGAVTATEGQRFELMVFPTPDTAQTVNYRYNIQPDDVTAALPYPLGGAQHGETFLLSCLAQCELRIKGEPGPLTEAFKQQLAASIVMDRRARQTEAEQFPVAPPAMGSYGWLAVELGRIMEIGANPALWTWSEQEAVRSAINRGCQNVLIPATTGNPRHRGHRWSFLSSWQSVVTSAPYNTGTVEIIDGVVTLSGVGASWPTWAAQGTLQIAGVMYFVASRTSNTVIVLEDTTVDKAAGTEYSLGRERYTLPSNIAALEPSCFTFNPGSGYPPIEIVHQDRIQYLRRYGYYSAYPSHVALATHSPNASAVTSRYLWLFPMPSAEFNLLYRVTHVHPQLNNGEYPPGGVEHANLYLEAAKAAHDPDSFGQSFLASLGAAIDLDQERYQSSPLGENADRSDSEPEWDYWKHRFSTATLFGLSYPT